MLSQALPSTTRPWISAYAPQGVTVSGPPSTLARLLESVKWTSQAIPIYGPYHAPHLYSQNDVDELVGSISSQSDLSSASRISLLSSAGTKVDGDDFGSRLKSAVGQILLHPIDWNAVLEVLRASLQGADLKAFNIAAIGTRADQLIYNALKQTDLRSLLPATTTTATSQLSQGTPLSSHAKPKLAIIGMSGRFPGAKDNEAFWDLLHQGLDMAKEVPPLHWDAKTHVDPTATRKNTSATPFGCWLDDPAGFDARFFNISPREAPQIDPAQRLALMTAYEAIEQAGIVPDATPSTRRDRVGVFYGVTSNDWMETNSAQSIDTYFIPGGNRAFIPGRINYCFKFSGPSYAVDTACSSSLAGIHLACNALWRGDIDTAIAGGTNVLTNPDFTAGLDRGHFLSRTGNCKTFDDSADGYCRGEGIGTIILKRYEDAVADKDPILATILDAATNHSAESESITRPHAGAQHALFKRMLNQGVVDPYSVSYVEMHGTGTQAGDAGEMTSVLETFAPPVDKAKQVQVRKQPLYLGSAKANIGHGEAASGISALIKVLMMMKKETIVPHCGIKTKINSKFPTDLAERKVNIALKATSWPQNADPAEPRRAFVNNFSAAGGNTALLIEDAPRKMSASESLPGFVPDTRSPHLVAISAKNGASLQGNIRSLREYLDQNSDVDVGKLSYTTTARRQHHLHRVLLTGATAADIASQCEAALRDNSGMTRPKSKPNVIFTFTGQGAQYPGMGKDLFDNFSFFRTEMRRLDQICQSLAFPSMLSYITSDGQDASDFAPIQVQLASVCMQIALTKLWKSWNITPIAVVGHSLGEYAALNAAGVLSDADTVYLVGSRAALLQDKCTADTHCMLVVKGSQDEVAQLLSTKKYEVACINSPIETVLAGPSDEIADLKETLTAAGAKSTLLKVPYAFHSSQIDPILEEFKKVAAVATYSDAKIPVLCPLDGSLVQGTTPFGPEYLARHSREAVNMQAALQEVRRSNLLRDQTMTLEIGSHPAVSGMVRAVLGSDVTALASVQRGRPVISTVVPTLKALYTAGADVRWVEYHRDFTASHEVISLPAYSWDLKPYWMQYVNDWSLRKGDPPLIGSDPLKLDSTTIHRVVEETDNGEKVHMVVEADITREDLRPLVQGHEVDGIPLCTPSVYGDIALTLGTYLLKRYHPNQKESRVDVSDMTISKALILRTDAPEQLLQAHADVDWPSNSALLKFMSFDSRNRLQEHSRCVLRFKDGSLQQSVQKMVPEIKAKIQGLRNGIAKETSARFNRPMVYRAIRPLARFHDDYRAIDEIVLDSNTLEASSKLSFGSVKRGGKYHTHPAIIDSLTQSCGFAMNCNDSCDLDKDVFMNHGWGSFQIFEDLDFDKTYITYTRMTKGEDGLWHGDVAIMDGDKVVAHFGKIAIQGVPRRILKVVLALENGSKQVAAPQKSATSASRAAPAATPAAAVTGAPTQHAASGSNASSTIDKALAIIAEESGLAPDQLTSDTNFNDVGIDSLLGLTIQARFKQEADIDLDTTALFYDYPTVADLKAALGGTNMESSGGVNMETSSSTASASELSDRSTMDNTPLTSVGTTPALGSPSQKVDFNRALQIVSEESGIAMEDLTDDMNFTDSGVDSLLSLVIVSRLRDELDLNIEQESLFVECQTVGGLRSMLMPNEVEPVAAPIALEPASPSRPVEVAAPAPAKVQRTEEQEAALTARRESVEKLVHKYTAGWSVPRPLLSAASPSENEKVVLVTGATGSLGGHLAYHLAQLPDVKTVVCLNREHRSDPYDRQQKAMREKGIRFPEDLKSKLRVFQTDTTKPKFGLSDDVYESLASSVSYLIHNAWPMSAKRALPGFEPQFQVFRNLIDFASDVAGRRPENFKFGFQMVSSIGVVGRYQIENTEKTIVPEDRVDIDCVLGNGYGEAKWGIERMMQETLHKHDDRFRTMAVRLGQIAGSKTSGYWNPMEHFGFLVKSSQTLNALPDLSGGLYWTPVNDIAGALSDLVLADNTPYPVYHIENPVGQSWREMNVVLAEALHIPTSNIIPFHAWMDKVAKAPTKDNPAATLLDFLDDNFLRLSCGGLILDTKHTLEHSKTLAAVGPVPDNVLRKYIHIWKEIGFLKASAEDRAQFDEMRRRLWG